MNPYAPPEGRIEDTGFSRRSKLGVAVWLALTLCVLHSLFFLVVPPLAAIHLYDGKELSLRLRQLMVPTLLLLPSLTLVAAWALYRRKRIAILPLACLPIVIAVHSSRVHVDTPIPYFFGGLMLAMFVAWLIVSKRLG